MGALRRSQPANRNNNSDHHRHQQQQPFSQHDGSVIFTHLFSAPLIERKMAEGGSGCVVAEKVDELSYEKEQDTLHKTLHNAGKRVRFLSEAANTKSFARAVGCRTSSSSSCPSSSGKGSNSSSSANGSGYGGGGCRDGECRIVHFTGHGVKGQLTFEDDSGQLQYVDKEELLSMLNCGIKQPRSARTDTVRGGGGGVTMRRDFNARLGSVAAAASSAAIDMGDFAGGTGYAPFEDVSECVGPGLGSGGRGRAPRGSGAIGLEEEVAATPRTGLQLVFLSSCYSQSVAQVFIEAGVKHVIAVKEDCKVLDHKAAEFASLFYPALLRGDTVRQAFSLGSAQLRGSDQPEEGHKFLLLPADGNHDVPVFEEVPAGQFVDATPVKPPYLCDTVTEYFWGRAVDVQKVVKHLVRGVPCVTITGQKGIGKTQVLLKACEYTRERHVFGDIFFCRVDKADRGNDACNWLEKGFQLQAGSLGAHNMSGAVARITEHVRGHLKRLRRKGGRPSTRVLLALDGCTQHVVVGQERVFLKDLLSRLFGALKAAGLSLTAAATMQATGPAAPGEVGVLGEKCVVVEALDARSTAELFVKCCPRSLFHVEMDPNAEAARVKDGKLDTYDTFAKTDIVLALQGHPGCVQDLCRRPRVYEDKSLFLLRRELLEEDIPKLQAQYAYEDVSAGRIPSNRSSTSSAHHIEETASDALEWLWGNVVGTNRGFYGPSGGGEGDDESAEVSWGRLCEAIGQYFVDRVPGARDRPLQSSDFDLFAADAALWRREDGPPPARAAARGGGRVSEVLISRKKLKPFWAWFWQAATTLRRTPVWSKGEAGPASGFAGFMRKDVALGLLSRAAPGTFLVRFSTSKPGALAIHYMATSRSRRGTVVSGIVNVSKAGALSVENGTQTFHDLDDLVLSTEQLRFIHPNVRKEDVFSRPQRRNTWAADGVEVEGNTRRQSMPLRQPMPAV